MHRRCDKPMHGLANRTPTTVRWCMAIHRTASRQGKPPPDCLRGGFTPVEHPTGTVPADGDLRALLALLHEDGGMYDISVIITPFKNVLENLKRLLGDTMVSNHPHHAGKGSAGCHHGVGRKYRRSWRTRLGGLGAQPAERGGNAGEAALGVIGDRKRLARTALLCFVMS